MKKKTKQMERASVAIRLFHLRGTSTIKLAELAGVQRATFSRVINGKCDNRSRILSCAATMTEGEMVALGFDVLWSATRPVVRVAEGDPSGD